MVIIKYGDDTALGEIQIACCSFINVKEVEGEWKLVSAGQFIPEQGFEVWLGVSRTLTKSMSTTWTREVANKISAGIEFKGISLGGEHTTTFSSAVTNILSSSVGNRPMAINS